MIKQVLAAAILLAGIAATSASAQRAVQRVGNNAMLGEVRVFGSNFCPRGWAPTHGQILPISGNEALFSLLGVQFGGDARSTFALPDLRGRVILGEGHGPGLAPVSIGQRSGGTGVSAGTGSTTTPTLGMTVCIATQGRFPSRN